MKAIRQKAQHRFLEAFMERESRRAGRTISYVEMTEVLGVASSQGFHQQLNRHRPVAVMVLVAIRRKFPEYGDLIDSLLLDETDCEDEWNEEIEKIFTKAREVVHE